LPHALRASPAKGLLGTRAEWRHRAQATLAKAEMRRRQSLDLQTESGEVAPVEELEELLRAELQPLDAAAPFHHVVRLEQIAVTGTVTHTP